MGREQVHRADLLGLGQRRLRAGLVEIRLRVLVVRLIGTRIDDEQHLALVDHRAVDEVDGRNVSGDARTNVHVVHGAEAAAERLGVGDGPREHARDRDLRGRAAAQRRARLPRHWSNRTASGCPPKAAASGMSEAKTVKRLRTVRLPYYCP